MFIELQSLLANRSLTITVAAVGKGRIRVNVVPYPRPEDAKANEQIKYSHKDEVAAIPEAAIKALTTPLSLTGTAEEIDVKLAEILLEYAESHAKLQASFDAAATQITDAVKAIEERNKNNKAKAKATAKPDEKKDHAVITDSSVPGKTDSLPLFGTANLPGATGTAPAVPNLAPTEITVSTSQPTPAPAEVSH
jgi:PRTRC genetic system protein E